MLHNIFSKTKTKPTKKPKQVKILADIHEKNSLVIPTLHELGADFEITHLKVGDYLINNIVIERKTFSDFISSMLSRRLIDQLKHLKQYPKALLLIEGKSHIEDYTSMNPNSYHGFIMSILLNYQIPIIFTEDPEETALYLHLLSKQQAKPNQEISLHARIPKTKKEQKKYVLESFPNIGPQKAKKLLKKFSTLSSVFQASEEELEEVLKSRAKEFKNLVEKK